VTASNFHAIDNRLKQNDDLRGPVAASGPHM
jgi:hypothetical protein